MRVLIFQFFLLIGTSFLAYAQQGSIRGTVFDGETGEYLPGVTIFVEGTTIGTATDVTGHYMLIDLEPGTHILVASSVGYTTVKKRGHHP